MRIIFFGSDDFAAVSLEALLASTHQLVACVTQPDKPQGRGMKVGISPIKQIALAHDIPYLQPATFKDASVVEALRLYKADIFVVVAYGRLLTREVLDMPKLCCVNVHGSLLPQYRGAAPINWAILDGLKETGVSVQQMALELDAGDIIAQERMPISLAENAGQLRQRMATVGAKLLVATLTDIEKGQHRLTPQDAARVSYAAKLTKEMGKIDWAKSAGVVYNQVRGLQPWPGAYTSYKNKMLKITQAAIVDTDVKGFKSGQVVAVGKEGFMVACADKALLIKEVHPEAGKIMPASSFLAGHQLKEGDLLA